ncbi:MAG: peptidase S10 [Verrucomicrobia bacterium]|nr:MAG: peptidase S10 [Verrucomicrobiota bacterium]
MFKLLLVALALLICDAPSASSAAEAPAKTDDKSAEKSSDKAAGEPDKGKSKPSEPQEKLVETKHSITINGQKVDYTAKAGTILLRDNEDKPTASIFHIAYTKDGAGDLSKRPITFSFNGGPGSSSVWLHLGLLGPRRALLEEDGSPLPPPYKTVDNDYSLLDETDLVFIDPVSTGFSRAVKPGDAKKFHSVEGDLRSVGEFIRLYTTRNSRWASPKFIIGESYGTTRAAGLSGELRERHRMNVNGIMLVSTVLNFETISFARGNDLPYVLYLPSYAATAWYHKKLPPDLQKLPVSEVVARAEVFAAEDYNNALLRGASLPLDKRKKIVKELARFTGLSEGYVDHADLRVPLARFAEELLRTEGRVIGRFDSRYKGYVRDRLANNMEYDPSGEAVYGAFTATFNQYVRTELKYESDLPYEILTGDVQPWNWGEQNRYLNVAETLAESLTRNPFLKVHVSSGYYDMATPWLASHYTFSHLGIDPALTKNITLDDYTSGHMVYLNLADLKKQKSDLARFIRSAAGL